MRSAVLLDGGTRFFGRRNVQAAFALRRLRRGPRSGSARSLRGEPPLRKTCPQRRFARIRVSAECRRPGAASRFRPFAGCVDIRSRTDRPEEVRGGAGRSPRKRASAEWGGRGLAPPAGAGRRDGASGPRPCRSSAAEDRTGCCGGSSLRRKRSVRKPERCEGCSAGIGRGGLRDCVVCGGTSVADEKDGSRMNGSPPPAAEAGCTSVCPPVRDRFGRAASASRPEAHAVRPQEAFRTFSCRIGLPISHG